MRNGQQKYRNFFSGDVRLGVRIISGYKAFSAEIYSEEGVRNVCGCGLYGGVTVCVLPR